MCDIAKLTTEVCDIAKLTTEVCDIAKLTTDKSSHKLSYTRKTGLITFDLLNSQQQCETLWRSSLRNQSEEINTICYHHGCRFSWNYKYCCDPFTKHNKSYSKTKGQVQVTVEMALRFEVKSIPLIPGWKLCRTCAKVAASKAWNLKNMKNVKNLMNRYVHSE